MVGGSKLMGAPARDGGTVVYVLLQFSENGMIGNHIWASLQLLNDVLTL